MFADCHKHDKPIATLTCKSRRVTACQKFMIKLNARQHRRPPLVLSPPSRTVSVNTFFVIIDKMILLLSNINILCICMLIAGLRSNSVNAAIG